MCAAYLTLALAVGLAVWGTYGDPASPSTGVASSAPETAPTTARLGAPAPTFALTSATDGDTFRLADFRGQPVLLNFWATWCPPCRTEMPEFQRFVEQGGTRAVVLGVDMQEDPVTVQRFLREYGISYRIALDSDGRVAASYTVAGLPTTVFVDSAGIVRDRVVGPLTYDGLAQRTARLP